SYPQRSNSQSVAGLRADLVWDLYTRLHARQPVPLCPLRYRISFGFFVHGGAMDTGLAVLHERHHDLPGRHAAVWRPSEADAADGATDGHSGRLRIGRGSAVAHRARN